MSTTKEAHPDSDLFAHATGPAQPIVASHEGEQPLKLYSGWFCPFVQRVWSVLEEKKIPYQYIEVNPYHKPDSLLKLNPRGLVPTLQYDNKPLYESTVICEFLEEAYPDHGPRLLPDDPFEKARVRIWTDFCTSRIIPAFHRFLQFQPLEDEEGLDVVRKEFLGKLKELAAEMDKEGPYFLGKEPGLIDFVVAPWIVCLLPTAHYNRSLLTLAFSCDSGSSIITRAGSAFQMTTPHGIVSGSIRRLWKGGRVSRIQRVRGKSICPFTSAMQTIQRRVSWRRRQERGVVCLRLQNACLGQCCHRRQRKWTRWVDCELYRIRR